MTQPVDTGILNNQKGGGKGGGAKSYDGMQGMEERIWWTPRSTWDR